MASSLGDSSSSVPDEESASATDTERAVLGVGSAAEILSCFAGYARERLGASIVRVCFRAGRIDVVWGVQLHDGRRVAIKAHRQPVDVAALSAAAEAMRELSSADFPCPVPVSGPDAVSGRVLSTETLLPDGQKPDGRDPVIRRLLAEGLAEHIRILRGRDDLVVGAGAGPSWCRYQAGPWPVPHDPIVNFEVTPDEFGWLDRFAARAADQITTYRDAAPVVVGHADWYAGNVAVADGVLVATFDWELVADTEAVIAGFSAASYAASSTSGGGLSSPDEVAFFLRDYDWARGRPLTQAERRAAAGAAAWVIAFNARWQLGMGSTGPEAGSALWLAGERADDYLRLTW